jgi:hypothetical protein
MSTEKLKRKIQGWLAEIKADGVPRELRSTFPMTDLQLMTYLDGIKIVSRAILKMLDEKQ